jgi:hypothetical protein
MDRIDVTGFAWVLADGVPINVNEWLIRNGFGLTNTQGLPDEWQTRFLAAEEEAQSNRRGVWGECELPEEYAIAGQPTPFARPTEAGTLSQDSSNGDQVVPFTIGGAGTYLFTLDVQSADAVFVALDVYTANGEWLPQFSITTADSGRFTSAGYLEAGDYYYQVKAVGRWHVAITEM